MNDRRLRERVPFEIEVELRRGENWVKIERSHDLSMGGVQILADEISQIGDVVDLRFFVLDATDSIPLAVRGSVVRVEEHGQQFFWGIHFDELSSDTSLFLYRLIQYHKS